MKTIYLQIKLLSLLLIVIAAGCTKSPAELNAPKEHKFTSKLLFNVAQTVTKSEPTENDVQRLDIMLFNKGKLEKIIRNITSFNTSEEGFSAVEVGFDTEGVRQAYVVANIDNDVWLNSLVEGVTTISQIATFQTASLTKMANPPLVMYGISEDIEFSTAQSSVLCQLYRAVARINIENKASNFVVTSARLINAKTASNIFPNSIFSSSEVRDFEPQSANGSNSIRLYTYEHNAEDVSNATKVEITGTVGGSPLTYTVDLIKEDNLIPLERNYQYTINVNNVQDNQINVNIEVVPWKLGSDIEEVLTGNKPVVDVTILPEVGAYFAADSSFTITSEGGQIVLNVRANAECGMEIIGNWLTLQPQTKAASYIAGQFTLIASENTLDSERNATIQIFNKLSNSSSTFSLRQSAMVVKKDKYMVLVIAGQSNAVGCDESPYDALDAPHPRAFQLSYRRGVEKRNLDIIPLTYSPDDIDNVIETNNKRLLKGIHLPLAKELLKNIPQDYKLLVIPVAYGGAGFTWGNTNMGYDAVNLQPLVMTGQTLRWGLNTPYHKTLVDRTKYALEMNPDNKLIGIVWCQGESDGNTPDVHYQAFIAMADSINEELNASFAGRSANGVIDKRSWFCYSSTIRFSDWYRTTETTAVFGGYKYWNPNTFIHIPLTTSTNLPGGVGQGETHFGQNAYRHVIAPRVADCIDKNGMLFNGTQKDLNRYKDKSTMVDANQYGGSITDEDLYTGLVIFAPFSESVNSTIKNVGSIYVSLSNQTIVSANDMPSLTATPRTRKVLNFNNNDFTRLKSGPTLSNWTVSFMFKRTGNMTDPVQTILHNGRSDSFFFGFHKLDSKYIQGISEFSAELSFSTNRNNTVPGLFFESEKVTRYDEWIHYVITYDNSSGNMTVYMNGEKVYSRVMSTKRSIVCSDIFLGSGSTLYSSAMGQMADFGVWNQVLSQNSIKKLFYMSYYGYTK